MNVAFTNNTLADTTYVRTIVFQWHADNNAQPPTQLLLLQTSNDIDAHYNHDGGTKFSVIYDKIHVLSNVGTTGSISRLRFQLDKMKFIDPTIKFLAGTTSGMEHMYVYVMYHDVVNLPNVQINARVIFTDS